MSTASPIDWTRIPVLLVSALLAACAVGPDYDQPHVASPDEFLDVADSHASSKTLEREFWRSFDDATLNDLIERALARNHDLRIALSRLREARALRNEARLDLAPTVTESASYVESRASTRTSIAGPRDQDYYETSFDAFWELDFFGRARRGIEVQAAELQAAEAGVHNAQVSITGEVARNYFELRGAQARLGVAQRNASNQRQTLQIVQARLDAGRGTQLDVSRASAQLNATLALMPELEASVTRATLRLGVLTGELPTALVDELSQPQPSPALPAMNAIGTPEALLRRRPDIRIAERELAAATARIGVAVGDLFPRISFVGSWGFAAATSDELGDSASETYGFGPSIRWAAFDLGRVHQRIKQREAAADGALARYEQSVLRALEETNASLTDYAKARVKQQHLQASAAASEEAADLARVRFENGVADFLIVLDAERSLLEAQDKLAQSETQTATALVATYKSLGGGFRPVNAAATAVARF